MILQAEGVTVRFGRAPAVDAVSFAVAEGEFAGILGPNGSGKSTLIRTLSRVLHPSAGRVLLRGAPLLAQPAAKVARTVAVVGQENPADFDFTVREIVAMGRYPHQGRWSGESDRDWEAIQRAMALTHSAAMEKRLFRTLSGGEKQRAIIARALAQEPQVLLLDEPSNHLDINHQVEMFDLLRRLNKGGLTVIAVMHDLNLAALYCRRLLLMEAGRLAADGAPADVLTPDLIRRVYGSEVVVGRHPAAEAVQVSLLPR